MSDVATKGFDPFLNKGVNYNEARRFYSQGAIPDSMKQKEAGASKGKKTPEQVVDEATQQMLDFSNKLENAPPEKPTAASGSGPTPALENKAAMDAYYAGPGKASAGNYQKYAPTVAQSAEAHGVPIGVALNLIHTESKFNPNAKSSKGATGIGQIMAGTAQQYGKNVNSLTPEQNIDLAMQIIADNYKQTGNWRDAASMYLTGRTIAKAGNASDGHSNAHTYAAAVVPTAYDWSKVSDAGYVRY
jgi:soluble lytic murein transglycosylase-like protein